MRSGFGSNYSCVTDKLCDLGKFISSLKSPFSPLGGESNNYILLREPQGVKPGMFMYLTLAFYRISAR